MKPNRNRARDLGFYVLLLVIMIAVIYTMTRSEPTNEVKSYSELVDLFQQEKVQYFATRPSSSGTVLYMKVRTDDPKVTEEMTTARPRFSFSMARNRKPRKISSSRNPTPSMLAA